MELPPELEAYVEHRNAVYGWQVTNRSQAADVICYELELTSQRWMGGVWKHLMCVCVPNDVRFPDTALLIIGADGVDGARNLPLARLYAAAMGMACAFVFDVPNQPLFDGRYEDNLIAHTFVQYLDSGDPNWPLLFPMTASAVRAMDAVQELLEQETHAHPTRFVTMGMSKRGWTTWLTAAVDDRVGAIIPMVYDNLNIFAQMPHQLAVWEGYSDQISDYTAAGLPQRMMTPEGQRLARMIDPFTYRERLTQPKLIVIGANDPYWATDSLSLYWDELPGPKWALDVPNVGHSLNDPGRVTGSTAAFVISVATGIALPQVTWGYGESNTELRLAIEAERAPVHQIAWYAEADGLDFRNAVWSPLPMKSVSDLRFTHDAPVPAGRCGAIFGEFQFQNDGLPAYYLSSAVRTLDRRRR